MSESNIDCFSTPPKNEVVYFLDWQAAYFLDRVAGPIVARYFRSCMPARFCHLYG